MSALFRQEVLDAKRNAWLGSIDLAMPVSYRVIAVLSLAACASLIGILCFGRYTRHEQISGELVPSLGLLTTAAPVAGTVSHMLVHDGDSVTKDQALVEISTDLDSIAVGKTREAISEELTAQRSRIAESIENLATQTTQKQRTLASAIAISRRQLQQIDAQLLLQSEQVSSASDLWHKFESATAKGAVSGLQTEQQRVAALNAQAEYAALGRQREDINQQLNTQQDQLRQLPLSAEAEHVGLQQKLTDINQTLAQNESQRAIVLRATQPGVVSNAAVKDGQLVASGQRLLSIIPRNSALQVELWLPSRAIGLVESGDRVVLHYQAFPYQKFGQQFGKVADISRSASSVSELSALLGRKVDEPLYRVVVELERQYILAYGKPENLKPGMTVDADILLDSRRLIEWVFEPLFEFQYAAAAQK